VTENVPEIVYVNPLTLQVYELQALAVVVFEVDNPSSMEELQLSSTPLHTSETPT
jgi:hypothetical protein